MNQRDLDEINRFLTSVGKGSLFEYFGVAPDSPDDVVLGAIKKRRAWAQGQQSNPKYKQEALWVIKNVARSRRAMVDEREAYVTATEGAEQSRKLQMLDLVIMGTLAEGVLSRKGEDAIREQGRALGLPDGAVSARLDKLLAEHKARRSEDTSSGPRGKFVDHYAVLDVHPDADINSLEKAYRQRYHAARQLNDPRRTEEIYQRLDDAWNVLKDPGSRARYDARRHEKLGDPLPGIRPGTSGAASPAPASPPPTGTGRGSAPERQLEPTSDGPRPRLRLGGDDESSGVTRRPGGVGAPRPPAGIKSGQTLGLSGKGSGAATRPKRAARLEVDGPETIALKVGSSGGTATITVRKAGSGALPGRVFVDRDWVTVEPARLDPNAEQQQIQVHVDGEGMGRNKAVALVTVVTDDGQRRSVTVEATRRSRAPLFIAAGLAVVAGVGFVISTNVDFSDPEPTGPQPGTLVVTVDPPAGEIYLNGDLVSTSGAATLSEDLPTGEPVRLRVEQDGFATWAQELTVAEGGREEVRVELELTDKMAWHPDAEDVRADIDDREVQRALGERRKQFTKCFRDHATAEPGALALLSVTARVNARGYIIGLDVDEENFESTPALRGCLKRQLRSIKLPLITGDYAVFKHQFRHTVDGEPSPQ